MLRSEDRVLLKTNTEKDAFKLAQRKPNIGLIVFDAGRLAQTGYEVVKQLGSNPLTKHIPLLLIVGPAELENINPENFGNQPVDYLLSPVNNTVARAKISLFERSFFQERELKEMQAQRDEANAQLQRTKDIATRLKTPVAGINGLVSLIRMNKEILRIDDVQDKMSLLGSLTSNLSEMLSSSFDTSESGYEEPTSTGKLISKCLSLLKAPSSISFKIESDLPIFKTKELKLQRIFQHLIDNAIKYTGKQQGLISIGVEDAGDFYRFYVKGKGATNENPKKNPESALNSLKSSVEEQGGKIWVEAVPGDGCKFMFLWKK
jgi:signal transduction histidine kinase